MSIDTSAVNPSIWEGELTTEKLDMIIRGLLIPSPEMARRLAKEVRILQDVRRYFWINVARPIINAIGELSVQEAMSTIDGIVKKR